MQTSCAVAVQLISAFGLKFAKFLYFNNFKLLTFFYDCIGRFVSDLVGSTKDEALRL